MVISAAEYASGVGVEEYVYDLRVVSTADVDEGIKLHPDGAFKCGEHGICVWVFQRNDVVGCVGC